MLSIVTSGLNAAQKDLSITANNLANAGTTGFKRSEATFIDLYSNDPTADPRTLIGGGVAMGEIDRSTSQGPMKTTGNVTDLAISGRGFFTLTRSDDSVIYTRAGNFTVQADGSIVDSQDNKLQVFSLDANNKPLVQEDTTDVIVPAEKSPGLAKFSLLDANGVVRTDIPVGANVTFKLGGAAVGNPYSITSADRLVGFVTLTSNQFNSAVADQISASFDSGAADVKGEFQKVFVQGLSIDTKGLISANFSDGTNKAIGSLAIATFAYEPGLRPVGDTNFVQSVESGDPVMTEAGAPAAGDIRSGMLEESNVDMTAELMQMLKAQQVYNGNARMMQTSVEMISRIVDKI